MVMTLAIPARSLFGLKEKEYYFRYRKHLLEAEEIMKGIATAEDAALCVEHGVHMLTASYATQEFYDLADDFAAKGALCIMEMGLDPGIDHMSAMRVIDAVRDAVAGGHELLEGLAGALALVCTLAIAQGDTRGFVDDARLLALGDRVHDHRPARDGGVAVDADFLAVHLQAVTGIVE